MGERTLNIARVHHGELSQERLLARVQTRFDLPQRDLGYTGVRYSTTSHSGGGGTCTCHAPLLWGSLGHYDVELCRTMTASFETALLELSSTPRRVFWRAVRALWRTPFEGNGNVQPQGLFSGQDARCRDQNSRIDLG